MHFTRVLPALAIGASLFAAGCGSDVDNSTVSYTTPIDEIERTEAAEATPTETATPEPTETATPEPTPTPTEAPQETPEPAKGGGGGGGKTLAVDADPGGQLAYTETELEAPAGEVTVDFTNEAPVPHDVVFRRDGEDVGGTEEISGGDTTATVTFEPGEYEYYCSVPGHEQAGMVGTLKVTG